MHRRRHGNLSHSFSLPLSLSLFLSLPLTLSSLCALSLSLLSLFLHRHSSSNSFFIEASVVRRNLRLASYPVDGPCYDSSVSLDALDRRRWLTQAAPTNMTRPTTSTPATIAMIVSSPSADSPEAADDESPALARVAGTADVVELPDGNGEVVEDSVVEVVVVDVPDVVDVVVASGSVHSTGSASPRSIIRVAYVARE